MGRMAQGEGGMQVMDGWGSRCPAQEGWRRYEDERCVSRTFFNLFFSATSSLPAFCACRFNCLVVNLSWKRDFSRPDIANG